jgi:hypothetical protein
MIISQSAAAIFVIAALASIRFAISKIISILAAFLAGFFIATSGAGPAVQHIISSLVAYASQHR